MAKTKRKSIDRIFAEGLAIDAALAEGATEALRKHVRAGVPAAEWKNGRVVWVSPRTLAARLRAVRRGKIAP